MLARYGGQLAGKIVVDITNPLDPETYTPLHVEAGSVAQEIAAAVPGAKPARACAPARGRRLRQHGRPARLGTDHASALKIVA